jgi:hypothetical protein
MVNFMVKIDDQTILIQYKNKYYTLFNYNISIRDGSIVFTFPRMGVSPKKWEWGYNLQSNEFSDVKEDDRSKKRGHKITYHTSGQINYDYKYSIFSEPLFQITKPFIIASYSVPCIEKLDEGIVREDSIKINVGDPIPTRVTFTLCISPWNAMLPENISSLNIRYNTLFALHLVIENGKLPIPNPEMEQGFIFVRPRSGLLERKFCSPDIALIEFHKKWNGVPNFVIYSPTNDGNYRLIFNNEMARPPNIYIEFYEDGFKAEIVENSSKVYARFCVKDRHGNKLKKEVKFKSITLTAEL